MVYKEQVHKNQQTGKISNNKKHTRHIAPGGTAQLYFIHHFNRK